MKQKITTFEIAKQALQLVGRFGTPPTPEVYEVWYRYVEDQQSSVHQQLSHSVNEAGAVTTAQLQEIHHQFCVPINTDGSDLGTSLSDQIDRLQAWIDQSRAAETQLGETLNTAHQQLQSSDTPLALQGCADDLAEGSAKFRDRLTDLSRDLQESEAAVESLQAALIASQRKLLTDPLTGLGNRRFFQILGRRHLQPRETPVITYLVVANLDRLKLINERYGHPAGDRMLQFVASEIRGLSPSVQWSRTSGDEFSTFITAESRDDAKMFAEDVKEVLGGKQYTLCREQSSPVSVTFSVGAAKQHHNEDIDAWKSRAGRLLTEAKSIGRNRSVVER